MRGVAKLAPVPVEGVFGRCRGGSRLESGDFATGIARCNLRDPTRRTALRSLALVTMIALAMAPAPALADDEPPTGWHVAGSALGTLFYSPVKLAYAAGGVVVGSLAWAWSFGSKRVARPIFKAALLGDYVVLPEHLNGTKKLEFRGR